MRRTPIAASIDTLLVARDGSTIGPWAKVRSSGLGDPLNPIGRLLQDGKVTTVTLRFDNGNRRHYRRDPTHAHRR